MESKDLREFNKICQPAKVYSFPYSNIKNVTVGLHIVIVVALIVALFTFEINRESLVTASYTVAEKSYPVLSKRAGYIHLSDFKVGTKVNPGKELFYVDESQPSYEQSTELNNAIKNYDFKISVLKKKIDTDREIIQMLTKKKELKALNRKNSLKANTKTLNAYNRQIEIFEKLMQTMNNNSGSISLAEKNQNMNLLLDLKNSKRKLEEESNEKQTASYEEIELLESINEAELRIALTETQISDLNELKDNGTQKKITTYSSPVDGVIKNINFTTGDYTQGNIAVITIATHNLDVIEGYLSPEQAAESHVDQEVQVKFKGYSVHEYGRHYAKIIEITPQTDKDGKTHYYFKAQMSNTYNKDAKFKEIPLTNGLNCDVTLTLEKRLLITLLLDKYTNWKDWQ